MQFYNRSARLLRRATLAGLLVAGLQLVLTLFGGISTTQAAGPSFMQFKGDRLTLNGQSITLKGTNFFPLQHSFATMWSEWDSAATREGLRRAAEMGDNSVRIMVPFSPIYGWTKANGSVVPAYLDELRQFLQLASEFQIRAIVTLFDFEPFAAPGSAEELRHRQYAHDIVTALRDDDRVLAWDLHNEPDNYAPWNTDNNAEPALTWLFRMRDYVKSLDPNHLITIGMGKRDSFFRKSAQGFTVLDLSDFLSQHSYNAYALADEIYELQQATNRQKPVVIEETGWPSGPVFSQNFNESIQLDVYKKTLEVANSHNVAGVFQWMLYDAEPSGIPPWDDFNNYFGLIRGNGTPKPVAAIWQNNFTAPKLPPSLISTSLQLTNQPQLDRKRTFYPQTNHWIGTPMQEFWRRAGGAGIFGYPITDAFLQDDIGSGRHDATTDQNKTPIYQYFEKGRLEYHPERRALPEYKVLGGLDKYLFVIDRGNVGLELAGARGYHFPAATRIDASDKVYQWFTQTSHSLQEPFLSFWRGNMGNYLFGSPISEPFEETNPETGQRRLVQYFEKGRLEYRPELAPTRSVIEVGNVGAELLKLKGWISQAYPDVQPVAGAAAEALTAQAADPSTGFADPAFAAVWQRTDKPVADGTASRTWLWGEKPLTTVREPYKEAPGGTRLVQYFDKSRMELTNPNADHNSKWYVTNGLLVREMVSGQVQVGDNSFEPLVPAQVPLAGDPLSGNPDAPTYASLHNLTGASPNRTGQTVDKLLLKDGSLAALPADLAGKTTFNTFIPETGHNIPGVFWNFLANSRGPVIENNKTVTGDVVDWLFSTGLPITEAYWTKAKVAGVEREVLVQAFERRVLTYTPSNSPAFQVEMGNVGLHYYSWRQGGGALNNAALPLDATTKAELDQSGGLAYRETGQPAFYKYAQKAGETEQAAALPGGVTGAAAPLPSPDLLHFAPEMAGRLALYFNDFKGNNRFLGYGVAAALNPSQTRVAYVQYTAAERADLFVQDLAGGPPQVVATNVLPFVNWSPDGAKLVFYLKDVNSVKIALSENGASPRVIFSTPRDSLATAPVFSPDGNWLAYSLLRLTPADRGPNIATSEVRVVNLATGEEKLVAQNAARPVFAPDGSALAYLGWNDNSLWKTGWGSGGITTPAQKLAVALGCALECANTGRPAFSPDGRWLAFTGPQRNLLAVRTGGGPAYLLTGPLSGNSRASDLDPVWVK
jgi:Tol biopolymer transport system component